MGKSFFFMGSLFGRGRGGPFAAQERVRIAGHVGSDDDGELHGEQGHVIPAVNSSYERDGERFVAVHLDNGSFVTVPERALRRA